MFRITEFDAETQALADSLYERAFPENEKVPLSILKSSCSSEGIRYRCLYDGGFVGLCYTIETEDILYVVYLAISEDHRSGGYGSLALKHLVEGSGKRVFLNIEPVAEDAPNYDQRVRRLNFYRRNGFSEHGLLEAPDGNVFMVMTANGDVSDGEIMDIYGRCGLAEMLSETQ